MWWLLVDPKLPPRTRALIDDVATTGIVSTACLWKIATKHRIGRLTEAKPIIGDLPARIAACGFHTPPITLEHGYLAGSLDGERRDPFDRMLAAQARVEGMPLVSRVRVFDALGAERIW